MEEEIKFTQEELDLMHLLLAAFSIGQKTVQPEDDSTPFKEWYNRSMEELIDLMWTTTESGKIADACGY